ncbi:MAG: beta-lactamase family protein [Oscillospiraceae bacterium]|nr:beta-lactamase family protein [Oscillospiraceae bacterium]
MKLLAKLTAILCAGLLLCSTLPAAAADDTRLPSGKTVKQFHQELENYDGSATYSDGTRGYASAAVGVFEGEEVLYTEYFGYTDVSNGIAADEDSVYEWGSISKTLVWVSVMQLYEQGRIELDRDIRDYLPEGFLRHLTYDDPITMLNLMNHNAGWQETSRLIWESDENAIPSLADALHKVEPTQIHRPGEIVAYSNFGAALAGYIVECVSGEDYCDYVHAHILDPLGLERTAIGPAHTDNAWVYAQRSRMHSYANTTNGVTDLGTRLQYVACYPAGAATGTLGDLMTYAQALSDPDAPLFEHPETQELLYTGTLFYGGSDIPACCHGFFCTEYAVRTYGHDGATVFGQALMAFDPHTRTGLVVMVNDQNGNWFLSDAPHYVFGELSAQTYGKESAPTVDLSGRYFLPARATYRGMLRFMPYMEAMQLDYEVQDLGSGVYQLPFSGALEPQAALLLGHRTGADGQNILEQPSCDLIEDPWFIAKLLLLTLYMMAAVAGVYLLRIRFKLRHTVPAQKGTALLHAGRIARIASVLLFLTTFFLYCRGTGGLTQSAFFFIGIGQLLCIAVCAVTAVCALGMLLKNRRGRTLCLMHSLANVFTVAAVLYYELYCFWIT